MYSRDNAAPLRESHINNISTGNSNTAMVIIGTAVVVLLLVLVFSGGMTGG